MNGWRFDGNRLRALREEAGIKLDDFAALIHRHPNHYRKIERSGHQPPGLLAWAIRRELSNLLDRDVEFIDMATKDTRTLRRTRPDQAREVA